MTEYLVISTSYPEMIVTPVSSVVGTVATLVDVHVGGLTVRDPARSGWWCIRTGSKAPSICFVVHDSVE